ncbi:hypothetical protein [Pseudomonas phage Astolliot]|nr:hypothetical protein [Pseudomonas phage Astolliot]
MAFAPTLTPARIDHMGHMQVPHDIFVYVTTVEGWSLDIENYTPSNRQKYLQSILYWMDLNGACIIRSASDSRFAAIKDITQCATILYGKQHVSGNTDPVDPVSDFSMSLAPAGGRLPRPVVASLYINAAHTVPVIRVDWGDGTDPSFVPAKGPVTKVSHTFAIGTADIAKVITAQAWDTKLGIGVGDIKTQETAFTEPPVSNFMINVIPDRETSPVTATVKITLGADHTAFPIEVSFGDGAGQRIESTTERPVTTLTHAYAEDAEGDFTIVAQAVDAAQGGAPVGPAQSVLLTIAAPPAPVSDFTIDMQPTSGYVPLTATLTITCTAEHTAPSVEVNWGDGTLPQTVATAPSVVRVLTHLYTKGPFGTVSVQAQSKEGGEKFGDELTDTIEVKDPPVADYRVDVLPLQSYLPTNVIATVTTRDKHTVPYIFIDWNDGSPVEKVSVTKSSTISVAHAYNGIGRITKITVQSSIDIDGTEIIDGPSDILVSYRVRPVSSFTVVLDQTDIVQPKLVTATITTDAANTANTIELNWGDGSPVETITGVTRSSVYTKTHTFDTGKTQTINVTGQAIENDPVAGRIPVGGLVQSPITLRIPLVAAFTATIDPTSGTLPLATNLTIKTGATNTAPTIVVDWGDGTTNSSTSVGANDTKVLAHTFALGTSPKRTVKLQAKDASGTNVGSVVNVDVTLAEPSVVEFTLATSPASAVVPAVVTATLVAGSTHTVPTIEVDWGDGTAKTSVAIVANETKTANHTYAATAIGVKTISAQAKASDGTSVGTARTSSVTLRAAPVANFTTSIDPTAGTTPLLVTATVVAGADHTASSVVIDWGDGTATSSVSPAGGETKTATHTYATGVSGVKNITFQAKDGNTNVGAVQSKSVSLSTPVVSSFTFTVLPTSGTLPLPVQLTLKTGVDNTAPKIRVDWGDGTAVTDVAVVASDTKTANHTYAVGTNPSKTITMTGLNSANEAIGTPKTQVVTLNEPPVIPSNGPGPSELIAGDASAGLFGDLSVSDLVTIEQIEALATVALPGTATNRTVTNLWVKYSFNNKILYIPKRTVRGGLNWNDIYKAGFVYGTDNNGLYPGVNTPTNQLKIVEKLDSTGKTWRFKIRLISVVAADPTSLWGTTDAVTRNSEFAKLVERTMPSNGVDVVWASYGLFGGVIGQSTWSAATEYSVQAGVNSNAYSRQQIQKVANSSWLPVLELIQD